MRLVIIVFGLMCAASSAQARNQAPKAGKCRYNRSQLTRIESNHYTQQGFLDEDRYASDWACIELKAHLKDDSLKRCDPDPNTVLSTTPAAPIRIEGKEAYHFLSLPFLHFGGLHLRKPYRYGISRAPDGNPLVTVRIHFKGALAQDASNSALIQRKLNEAATIWSSQSPGGKVHFRFLEVGADQNPDFSVKLQKKNKPDLYNSSWSLPDFQGYGASVIAHEIGHMMGIPDEYDPVREVLWEVKDDADTRRCDVHGLMCNPDAESAFPGQKTLYAFDYYLILRRASCLDPQDLHPTQDTAAKDAAENTAELLPLLGSVGSTQGSSCAGGDATP